MDSWLEDSVASDYDGGNDWNDNPEEVGIDAAYVYFPQYFVSQSDLEIYDNCEGKYTEGLGQIALSCCGDNEDAVSMAMNALHGLLRQTGVNVNDIGRLEVGTESSVDRSKSIKSFLMRFFEEEGNTSIEGVDNINACYGGTAAMLNTVAWMQSEAWDGRLGLVVASDVACYSPEHHFATSAAAVALLIAPGARLVIERNRSSCMQDVYDFYKPVSDLRPFAHLDGPWSVECYLNSFDNCAKSLKAKMGVRDLIESVDHMVFHLSLIHISEPTRPY